MRTITRCMIYPREIPTQAQQLVEDDPLDLAEGFQLSQTWYKAARYAVAQVVVFAAELNGNNGTMIKTVGHGHLRHDPPFRLVDGQRVMSQTTPMLAMSQSLSTFIDGFAPTRVQSDFHNIAENRFEFSQPELVAASRQASRQVC